jgi:hypothetical protein
VTRASSAASAKPPGRSTPRARWPRRGAS